MLILQRSSDIPYSRLAGGGWFEPLIAHPHMSPVFEERRRVLVPVVPQCESVCIDCRNHVCIPANGVLPRQRVLGRYRSEPATHQRIGFSFFPPDMDTTVDMYSGSGRKAAQYMGKSSGGLDGGIG